MEVFKVMLHNYFATQLISTIHNLSRTPIILYTSASRNYSSNSASFCPLLIMYLCLSAGDGISFVFFTLHGHKFHNWFPHMDLNLYIDEDGLPQLSHWLQYWLVNDTNLFVQAVNKLVRDCCKIGCTLKSDSSMYYIFLSLIMD